MPLATRDGVLGVVLLCAHPRNALYVAKWTFMCPLRGPKMGRLGAVLGHFFRCWGHEVPCLLALFRPGRAQKCDMGHGELQGVCWWCCSDFFCFAGPRFSAFGTFLPQAWGFYVGLCGCFRGALLCVFMWVTLSGLAKL